MPNKKRKRSVQYDGGSNKKRRVGEYDIPDAMWKIKNINDLIKLGLEYKGDDNIMFRKLWNLIPSLIELDNMIGMHSIKKDVVEQIIYFIQGYGARDNEGHMLHCAIYGNPGCGKTKVASLIGEIYRKLGYLSSDKITYASRDTLIAEYLGQTAVKTKKLLDKARGGVLIIDEVYSLGSGSDRIDIYSKECIDTINQYLSENKNDLLCIVIGYKKDVDACFFSVNSGLERRFPFRYTIEEYTPEEIVEIFMMQVKLGGWGVWSGCGAELLSFVKGNKKMFSNTGGDTENLFFICKTSRAFNTFGRDIDGDDKFVIEEKDLLDGIKKFSKSRNEIKKGEEMSDDIKFSIYT